MERYTQAEGDRFWSKVDVIEEMPDRCMPWRGQVKHGRPVVSYRGDLVSARRMAYELFHGLVLYTKEYIHLTCRETDLCMNPLHLRMSLARARLGEFHPSSRLTDEIVRKARYDYHYGKVPLSTLAAIYGTARGTMRDIVLYRSWKHVRREQF